MAHELGISRATVRQALNTLGNEGLLVRNPATRVLEVISLDANDISEIYRARKVLEHAGVEASRTASASELAGLQHAVDGMQEAVENDDVFAFVQADSLCLARTVEADEHITSHGLAQHQEFCRLVQAGEVDAAKANLTERLDEAEQGLLSHNISPGMRISL